MGFVFSLSTILFRQHEKANFTPHINPLPAGPPDFPRPAGGLLLTPPCASAPAHLRPKRKTTLESSSQVITNCFDPFWFRSKLRSSEVKKVKLTIHVLRWQRLSFKSQNNDFGNIVFVTTSVHPPAESVTNGRVYVHTVTILQYVLSETRIRCSTAVLFGFRCDIPTPIMPPKAAELVNTPTSVGLNILICLPCRWAC